MTQVFVNLIDNAMKVLGGVPPGPRGVAPTWWHEVAVAVADAGIGIAPDDQGRIFDRSSTGFTAGAH